MMARGDLPQLQRTPDIKYCRLFSHSFLATQLLHHFPFKFGNSSFFLSFVSACQLPLLLFLLHPAPSFLRWEEEKEKEKEKRSRRSKKKKKKRREEEEKIREYLIFFPAGFEILMFYLLMGLGF
jgi:hypothetical protein